jgi:hypothetical protein
MIDMGIRPRARAGSDERRHLGHPDVLPHERERPGEIERRELDGQHQGQLIDGVVPVFEGDGGLEPQQVGQPEGQAHHRQVECLGRGPVEERTEPDGHLEGAVGGPHTGPSITWPIHDR